VASVLILVFMYRAVAQTGPDSPVYAYIYLGNAFYIYVGAVMVGASYSILDDRERYRTLKYLYAAPISVPVYLLGRAVARFLTGSLAVVITLAAGVLLFGVPLSLAGANWPMFLAALALGVASLALMGLIVGMWTLTLRVEPWFAGEMIAAALYLFSGAIFPITVLPRLLQPVGYALPLTYWLELVRRALLGPAGAAAFPALAHLSDGQIFGILGGITLALAVLAALAFTYFDRRARELGLIDAQSNF
jgi:ABC-2 type transport system permease protein